MLIAGFPAGSLAANCYVVAPAAGQECVVIDPGQNAVHDLDALVAEHHLRPVAVLLTHGHFDHTLSVLPVCGARDVPAYIHPADRAMLADPAQGFDTAVREQLLGGMTFAEPDDVRELTDGHALELAGLTLTVDHAPGHTGGSVTYRLATGGDPDVLFTGDLLFAGSIGRSDLPGGDPTAIMRSLARVCLPLPDETVVLPGHGDQTTIGRERATNPFLREPATGGAPEPGQNRGL